MAQGKKISELTELSSVTDNDEFLFVDKEGSGANSGTGGSNVKIKFSDLKMAITDGMKGEPGMDAEKGQKGEVGERGIDGGGAAYFTQSPTNGSDIYYSDLDGSIGIGTDAPDNSKLHVAEGHINLDDNNAIAWGGGNQRPAVIGHKTDKVLQFYTDSSPDVTIKDKNVGIGTDSPSAPLTIVEQSNVALKMLKSSGQTLFTIGEDGGNNVVLDSSTVDLSGNVVSSDLVIKGGNVGIGPLGASSNAGDMLHISTSELQCGLTLHAETKQAKLVANSAGSLALKAGNGGNATEANMSFEVNGAEAMRINNAGNVGIGNATPNEKLRVTAGSNLRIMGFEAPLNGSTNQLIARLMGETNGSNYADSKISFDMVSKDGTTYNPALTLASGGNVGIGTISPIATLQVENENSTLYNLMPTIQNVTGCFRNKYSNGIKAGTHTGLQLNVYGNEDLSMDLTDMQNQNVLGYVGIVAEEDNTNKGSLVFHSSPNGTDRVEGMRLTSENNLGIGTTSPLPFSYRTNFENPNVKGIHIHAPQNPQVRLTSTSAGNTQSQGAILGTNSGGGAYLLNEHPGAGAMLATTPAIDETKLRGEWNADASNGETPGTYKAGDIVYVDHENGMRDYFHAHVDLTAPVANPVEVSNRFNLYNHLYDNNTTWKKHHYLPKLSLSSEGDLTLNGASTDVGTETFEGYQLKQHPSAKFQINGYGTQPPTRNAGLFLNASTKGGHPAVLFGHNNAINWSVKSDPDENHDFTIRNHNFGFDENNIALPNMTGSEAVFKISNGSHSTHTSFSGSRPAQELNSVVGAVVSRNPSFSFHNTFDESTLSSGGLAEGLRNPTLARFQQNYNHTGNDGSNGDYLDISIVGAPYVDFNGNQASTRGHYSGMAIASGYGSLFLTARNSDRDGKDQGNKQVEIHSDGRFTISGSANHIPSMWTYNYAIQDGKANQVGVWANADQGEDFLSNANGRTSYIGVFNNPANSTLTGFLNMSESNGNSMALWCNGTRLMISTSMNDIGGGSGQAVGDQTSDERLKNIKPEFNYGLEQVLKLKPIEFSFKSDDSVNLLGFGAQTTKEIIPEVVYDTKECLDGYETEYAKKEDGEVDFTQIEKQTAKSDKTKLAMQYAQLIPVLTKAIQELKAEVDALKNK